MDINDAVAKLARQHDRGMITSDDYVSELRDVVRLVHMELTAKYTVTIVEDGEVTENYASVPFTRVREVIGSDFCVWGSECTDAACQPKAFMDQLKRLGQAMIVKRDTDGEDAYTRVYTAYVI